MGVELEIKEEAYSDIAQGYQWYEEKQEGLGEKFKSEIKSYFDRICKMPEMYPKKHGEQRAAVVKKYPYVIFYIAEPKKVTVFSVFNTSQSPDRLR